MTLCSMLLYATLAIILSACTNNQNIPTFTPLQKDQFIELEPACRMGGCSWTKIQSVDIAQNNNNEILMTVKVFFASTDTEDYTKKPQSWSEGTITKIYCSKNKPSLHEEILDIDKNRFTGQAELSALNLYFAVCHSFIGDPDEAKTKFNY